MSLLRYSLRRLLLLVPTLFGVTVVAFVLLRVLPGDPIATILGQTAGEEEIAAARARFGLDNPIIVQFWDYLTPTSATCSMTAPATAAASASA